MLLFQERRNISAPMTRRNPPHTKRRQKAETPQETWLFGHHAVAEALKNDARSPLRLVASRNAARDLPQTERIAAEILEPRRIDALLPSGAVHQGVALLARPLPEPELEIVCAPAEARHPVIILDQVTDPHNVGAIMRTAAAFGARALITTRRHSPELTGTLAKSASGAVEHLPYVRVANLSDALRKLADLGYHTIGLAEEGARALRDIAPFGPTALVLGAEGTGLRKKTRDICAELARLPTQPPIGSLNVSNAAAVALYEVVRK